MSAAGTAAIVAALIAAMIVAMLMAAAGIAAAAAAPEDNDEDHEPKTGVIAIAEAHMFHLFPRLETFYAPSAITEPDRRKNPNDHQGGFHG